MDSKSSEKFSYRDEFERGNFLGVKRHLEKAFEHCPDSPFAEVLSISFSNSAIKVADELKEFLRKEGESFEIRAVYTEMNGFAWNTNEWFYNWFAYELPLGHPDGALSGYDSENNPCLRLEGMEKLQKVYEENSADSEEEELCSMLVVVKFYELILRALETIDDLPFPIVVDSHELSCSMEIRRHQGQTYLGRQCRHLDEFGEIPSQFDKARAGGKRLAYEMRNASSEDGRDWLHRAWMDYQVEEASAAAEHCEHFCCKYAGATLSEECSREYLLIAEVVEMAEGWPDFVDCNTILVSERLRNFLMKQEGAEKAYQWLEPVYPKNGIVPEVRYQILNLLDHREALDLQASELDEAADNELDRIITLALREEAVDNCLNIFRLAEGPIKGGILVSRQLAWALNDEGFTGFNFYPVELGERS